ncbi:hypothetical protein Krac_5219 [Ktedonobacter racemifer DSM 44963]|uniref:Uncharacterized protein n=1 Tax=Ktedonobacter racemifer DSM 44963 TaxID=485913 RepID=D6TV97_KTERA|nr:hypothetical protein Krac_5219 [Ktedonobacter racemifer DSM 44963]
MCVENGFAVFHAHPLILGSRSEPRQEAEEN